MDVADVESMQPYLLGETVSGSGSTSEAPRQIPRKTQFLAVYSGLVPQIDDSVVCKLHCI
jgi:hypothetical protein